MPTASPSSDLFALQNSLASLSALLASLQGALHTAPESPRPPQLANPPNPLALLSDAAALLKAQTTKLSLLLLNKPFSVREVTHIVSTLSKSIIPALLSVVELLHPSTYTVAVNEHVRGTLGIISRELLRLLKCVPTVPGPDAPAVAEAAPLASTGVLWEQCDELVSVGEIGVRGVVDKGVRGYGELLDDAIAEIEEWDPDGESDEDEDEGGDNQKGEATVATPTASDEEALEKGVRSLRLSAPHALKARVLKFLRILRLFYPALRKRRIETYPNITRTSTKDDMLPPPQQVRRLDELVGFAKQFSEETDELAGALYAHESEEVESKLRALAVESKQCASLMETDWKGQEDEFCTWLRTWQDRVGGSLTI
ncbi:MAG: hypothetical protein OHK93_004263 [Ramalina farinacea]|uniref:Cyclin-D1-binding protein 1-like N-terminal domain-containing protein n=1 Tax=Ramalina farinacea TaxID=258253 RepID=A0AA43QGF6_9LECA|nr:hypothetical protein [Ramalina farinacea]